MPRFDYIRPGSIAEAINLLNDPAQVSRPLAGGTDLLVLLRHEEPDFDRLVDISMLPELRVISRRGDVITLGACVTFGQAVESEVLQETTPFLVEACRAVGGPQIRNAGTIGGNVVNAAACADSLPVLVCLDAVAHLRGRQGERAVPVAGFVLGHNRTQLEPGELLTHFTFDAPPPGVRTVFFKVGRRRAQAISRLTMAAMGRLDAGGRVDFIRITPGSATPQTVRFAQAEEMLLGQRPTDELIAAVGRRVAETMISITGRRWSTEYKEPVIAALTERALRRLFVVEK
jgi:CO/xanthine dehydrogenase FAD-binding subunit